MAGEVYRQSGNFGIGPISGGKMGAGANVALCHQRSGETESS
ncbi:hypothetical protein [Microseira sp. BLCC-F43]|jgi:hypothetical protein